MNRRFSLIMTGLLATMLLLFSTVSQAENQAEALLEQIDKKRTPASYESYFNIINQQPDGREKKITAFAAKRSDGQAAVLIVSPPALRGRAALRMGNEIWTHFPGETQLRKSTLRHALVGGVFNNGDFLATSFQADHDAVKVREVKGRYILTLLPKQPLLPYQSIELTVNKRTLRPLSLVQFASPGVIIKTIQFDYSRRSDDGKTTLTTLTTRAEANKLYRSEIRIGRINKRDFPDTTFTKELLPRLGSILK
ncbi:MAG: outer membrane lipoprotein-sorting protein [Magnetococcales bacterium]|nr:outer membrane lipoprotein-sorting protein [Magnetococcales bacterium]